jgi:hypothetical protein
MKIKPLLKPWLLDLNFKFLLFFFFYKNDIYTIFSIIRYGIIILYEKKKRKRGGKSINKCFSCYCYRMNHIFRFIDKIQFNSQIA